MLFSFIVWVAGWNLDIKELCFDRRNPPLSQLWHHLILHLQEGVDGFVSECRTNSFQVWPFCWSSAPRSLVFLLVFSAVLAIRMDFCLSHVKHMVLSPVSFFQFADKLLGYGLWHWLSAVSKYCYSRRVYNSCFWFILQEELERWSVLAWPMTDWLAWGKPVPQHTNLLFPHTSFVLICISVHSDVLIGLFHRPSFSMFPV